MVLISRERRAPGRKPLGYSTWIERDGSSERIPCRVSDESEQGAQISTQGSSQLPDTFMLYLGKGRVARLCEVVWRGREVTGVKFLRTILRADPTDCR